LNVASNKRHLLVVDDDRRLRERLQKYLRQEGFLVTVADSASTVRILLEMFDVDLIIMDIMMPDVDGITLTEDLRRNNDTTPVIMLTARNERHQRIMGYDAGADDYMSKPFDPEELVKRIKAVLRRIPATTSEDKSLEAVMLGGFRFDIPSGKLWDGEKLVKLTATQSEILRILAAKPREAVSRSRLKTDAGNSGQEISDRAIDVRISRLRQKLNEDPQFPRYLKTVRGVGYMLIPD